MAPKPQIRSLKKKQPKSDASLPPQIETTAKTQVNEQASQETAQKVLTEKAKEPSPKLDRVSPTKTLTKANIASPEQAKAKSETTTAVSVLNESEPPATTIESDSETDKDQAHFQAIGTLYGAVTKTDENIFFIQLGRKSYRLFFQGYRYAAFTKQYENNPQTPLYFRVYPKYRIIPRKPPEVYFQPIAWDEENTWNEPGLFILKGVWQFIPQNRTPMISIYRNGKANDPTGKFKAAHIPVLMRREDEANPFRFNPKIAREELPSRWFIQAIFRFMSSRDCWGWVEDLDPPTKEIPWYKKPRKDVPVSDKADEAKQKTENKPMGKKETKIG